MTALCHGAAVAATTLPIIAAAALAPIMLITSLRVVSIELLLS